MLTALNKTAKAVTKILAGISNPQPEGWGYSHVLQDVDNYSCKYLQGF